MRGYVEINIEQQFLCVIYAPRPVRNEIFKEKLVWRAPEGFRAGLTTSYKGESDVWREIGAKEAPRIFLPTITRE